MPDLGVHRTASILEKIRKSARLSENLWRIQRGKKFVLLEFIPAGLL